MHLDKPNFGRKKRIFQIALLIGAVISTSLLVARLYLIESEENVILQWKEEIETSATTTVTSTTSIPEMSAPRPDMLESATTEPNSTTFSTVNSTLFTELIESVLLAPSNTVIIELGQQIEFPAKESDDIVIVEWGQQIELDARESADTSLPCPCDENSRDIESEQIESSAVEYDDSPTITDETTSQDTEIPEPEVPEPDRTSLLKKCFEQPEMFELFDDVLLSERQPQIDNTIFFLQTRCFVNHLIQLHPRWVITTLSLCVKNW